DLARVRYELHEVRFGPQSHLTVGELEITGRSEPPPDGPHLRLHIFDGARADVVRVGAQVAAAAREIAARHHADRAATPCVVASGELSRCAQRLGQARPSLREDRSRLGCLACEAHGHFRYRCSQSTRAWPLSPAHSAISVSFAGSCLVAKSPKHAVPA